MPYPCSVPDRLLAEKAIFDIAKQLDLHPTNIYWNADIGRWEITIPFRDSVDNQSIGPLTVDNNGYIRLRGSNRSSSFEYEFLTWLTLNTTPREADKWALGYNAVDTQRGYMTMFFEICNGRGLKHFQYIKAVLGG